MDRHTRDAAGCAATAGALAMLAVLLWLVYLSLRPLWGN